MSEIKEKFLPIGTIVLLKDGNKKVMITSYLIFPSGNAENKNMYDYGGCTYPEGVIDSKLGVGFNHDQIAEIVHMGLEDDDFIEFKNTLNQYADEFKQIYNEVIVPNEE